MDKSEIMCIFALEVCKTKMRRKILLLLFVLVASCQILSGGGDLYARYIYPVIAKVLSALSALIPFSVSGVFYIVGILVLLLYPIYAITKHKQRKLEVLWIELELVAWLYVWFYAAWGLNYCQSDFYQRTSTPRTNYDVAALKRFADEYVAKLNESYVEIKKVDKVLVRQEVVKQYARMGEGMGIHAPFSDQPHEKTMLLTPLASMVGVTGTMGPFFGEFIVNGDLLPCEYAATYAHELSHLLGITSEGEANFYGYLACTSSDVPEIRFSGYLSILHYVLQAMREAGRVEYNLIHAKIRPEIHLLELERRIHWMGMYNETLGEMQDRIYDFYLRHNRIEVGRKSYSDVIDLLMSYNN